ncbi:MAG: ATP-binding cassette domain-containing protein [Oscillospiraceae bacterium]|jgi:ABC-2 type transport system ATP-binding protein
MQAITAEHLSKTYHQGKKAVSGICLAIEPGEVFGFLGPNGAGKTTTVKLLNGILSPTDGSCRVFGIDPAQHPAQVHQISGVVTEHAQMYDHMTGLKNLVFYGMVFGVGEKESETRAVRLLEMLSLIDAANQKLATYSTGMRQRLSLARAMMHRPKVLFLDEPTSGLDPESTLYVNNMIKDLARREGTTVFLCTHQLRYAQEICSSYGLMDDGRLFATGRLDALRSMVSSELTVKIGADDFPEDIPHKKVGERMLEVRVPSESEIPFIVRRIVEQGGDIYHVSVHRLSLEEIYFSLLKRRKNKEGNAQ